MSLMLAGTVAAGAASGAAGGMFNKGSKISVPKYTEHEKKLTSASQFLIPQYLKSLTGGMTPYTQALMQQLRSQGAFGAQQNVSGFLRNVGARTGGDFGAGATGRLSEIYSSFTPSLMQAISNARMQQMNQATQGLQQWSMIKPGTKSQPEAPGPGKSATIGALQGLGRGLGGMGKPGAPSGGASMPAMPNSSLPAAQQGPVRPPVALEQTLRPAQNATKSPFFPQGMFRGVQGVQGF